MSREWVKDIYEMHDKYGVHGVIENMDKAKLHKFLEFRLGCVAEELDELNTAISEGNAEETVDALIDICVFGYFYCFFILSLTLVMLSFSFTFC